MARDTTVIEFWFYDDADKAMDDREAIIEQSVLRFPKSVAHKTQMWQSGADAPHKGDLISVVKGGVDDNPDFEGVFFVDDRIIEVSSLAALSTTIHIIASPPMGVNLATGTERFEGVARSI